MSRKASVFSRALPRSLRSVGYVMSAGVQLASTRSLPALGGGGLWSGSSCSSLGASSCLEGGLAFSEKGGIDALVGFFVETSTKVHHHGGVEEELFAKLGEPEKELEIGVFR